ncbi:uncharacterized protein [Spinacia oleracea]|uniref:DUF4408 domain-containing protein n=1 Tax=Spinacia oleracea TaxID=3562 RepID=A0A9R0JGL8_SPIOL|nr:uncharacterized protein LOC110805438 [Spinacia oleracea]
MEQLTQFNIVKSMKKVQSAYLYSFFLLSSSLALLILHLSSVSIVSVLKFNIDRNHVFLICNGILVILVKSSSSLSSQDNTPDYSSSSSSSSNVVQSNDQCLPRPVVLVDQRKLQEELSTVSSEQKATTDVKVARFSTVEETVISEELHVHYQTTVVVSDCEVVHTSHEHEHEHEHDDGKDDHDEVVGDDDDNDDEGAEELNKRCEEFIRRMKQGIISERKKDLGLPRFS